MGFALYVWPIDRAITRQEAAAELGRLADYDRPGKPADDRLRAFIAELRARFPDGFPDDEDVHPDSQPPDDAVVFELHQSREHVFVGIPWSLVRQVGAAAQKIAFAHDLMLYDPQSETAIMPPGSAASPSTGRRPTTPRSRR